MFLIFTGPPFEDMTVLPSPSLMGMACGRFDRERKTWLRLNIWCEAPESIIVREVERGDDRKAKDSRMREDNRVCLSSVCLSSVCLSSVCLSSVCLSFGQSERFIGGFFVFGFLGEICFCYFSV